MIKTAGMPMGVFAVLMVAFIWVCALLALSKASLAWVLVWVDTARVLVWVDAA